MLFLGRMKATISSFFAVVFVFAAAPFAFAESQVYLSLQNQESPVFTQAIDLPEQGVVSLADNTGAVHDVDARSILAILSRVDETSSEFEISVLKYYSQFSSFFLECIKIPTDMCGWWQYVVDGVYGSQGMDKHVLQGGETVYIYFNSYQEVDSFPARSTGAIGTSFAPPSDPAVPHKEIDEAKAAQFLAFMQNEDGSFGNAVFYSDWAALALGAYGDEKTREKLRRYLLANPDPGSLLTDYERRAMALLALGLNPYSSPWNYIQGILDEFDGKQFGSPDLFNDDIFAIIPLVKVGYTNSDAEVKSSISFLLGVQGADGSWGKDVDLTAAAVQALSLVSATSDVQQALGKARAYLKTRQDDLGGFGNVYSTSWAMQAISALGEDPGAWVRNGRTPEDYVQFFQVSDGGLKVKEDDSQENRIWMTSYALPAAMHKSWGNALAFVAKQEMPKEDKESAVTAVEPEDLAFQDAPVLAQDSAGVDEQQFLAIQQQIEGIQLQIAVLQAEIQKLAVGHFASIPVQETQAPRISQAQEILESPLVSAVHAKEQAPEAQEEQQVLAASVEKAAESSLSAPLKGIAFVGFFLLAMFVLAGGTKFIPPGVQKLFAKT